MLLSADVVELGGERVMLSNGIDVTEQRRAEAALRETQARFAKIFQSSPVPVVISRLEDGRYLEVNDAWLAWSGHARTRTIGATSVDLGVWTTAADRAAFTQRLLADTAVRNLEARMRKRSGEVADVLLSAEPLELGGEPCIVTSVMDITERKRAERQLRESERRFRDFAEAAGEYVWEIDVDGRFTYVSRRVEQVTGYSPEELLGRAPIEFMPAGEGERVREVFAEAARARELPQPRAPHHVPHRQPGLAAGERRADRRLRTAGCSAIAAPRSTSPSASNPKRASPSWRRAIR